jgi:hypothetical protein
MNLSPAFDSDDRTLAKSKTFSEVRIVATAVQAVEIRFAALMD